MLKVTGSNCTISLKYNTKEENCETAADGVSHCAMLKKKSCSNRSRKNLILATLCNDCNNLSLNDFDRWTAGVTICTA